MVMYQVIDDLHMNLEALPRNGSLINYSMLRDLRTVPVIFRSFSIKYVLEGCESYMVNNNLFHVTDGQYLLANPHSEGSVAIDSEKVVKGICIDIAPRILSEVVASHLQPGSPISDQDLDRFFTTPDFFENCYASKQTHLGKFLGQLGSELDKSPFEKHEFTEEFYFTLSEKLLLDHIPVVGQLQSIRTVKTETRKALLRRVMHGKEYIDTCFAQPLTMELVALESGLSEYHFFRLFKAIFFISPHQYLIRKRLEFAHFQLQNGRANVSEAAHLSGFGDIFAFSKSFKKHFGLAPSQLNTKFKL
jgi:AraC family transcriptional regulator